MSGEYLRKENWPGCIPWTEPTEKNAPQAWSPPDHDHDGVDEYPSSHPAAASIDDTFLGDVCPYCGVPLSFEEFVILADGTRGKFYEIDDIADPSVAYHDDCYWERQGLLNTRLTEFESP